MKSFLKEIEEKFITIESNDYCDSCDRVKSECVCEELDEMSATGAVAGFSTPAAFAKPGKWKGKQAQYESINKAPSFRWKETEHQKPESGEETSQDKFPFSSDLEKWPNKDQEYPVKFTNQPYGTANIEDDTIKLSKVHDMMDRKYEELIESYRAYATGDSKSSPESKIKNTIKEVAKKLQEIEQTINYASKLKTESGVTRTGYGPAVESALNKISSKLIKISERVRALGE